MFKFNKKQEQQSINRRPADNLTEFAKRYELPHVVDPSGLRAQLGIQGDDDKLLTANYQFHPTGDSYWAAVAERQIGANERPEIERKILNSPPIPGVTERIMGDRLVAMLMKDGLTDRTNVEQQRGYQDDVARFATHYSQIRKTLD